MPSTFNGLAIFDSGPHRFASGAAGQLVVPYLRLGIVAPGSAPLGPLEVQVTVAGRLVADKDSDLWALRADIEALLTTPPTVGTLIDNHGHEWENMAFVRFQPADRTDRARSVSLAYTATFLRFLTP